ncbi:hypothetical protein OS493_020051 [Desmophyllum pertusum]|uniref:Uncharacterized protein n=1 Tax=Desmophyllum pertusum TaxID=174260 RepID=A0A9W9YBF2_9CNID|nr:hypothetical protein OS493_020051 [Desmophyllum pertusum]
MAVEWQWISVRLDTYLFDMSLNRRSSIVPVSSTSLSVTHSRNATLREVPELDYKVPVPAQRLVYKFNRLPYKYEPGVTRSLRHARQINASITNEQDQNQSHLPPQITTDFSSLPSAFIPTSTPVSKGRPWPVMAMPTRPVWWYPGSSLLALKPPVFYNAVNLVI